MTTHVTEAHRVPITRPAALLLAALLAAIPATANAHAELVTTDPVAGGVLDAPPTEVALTFDGELAPDGSGFTVTDANGTEVGSGMLDLEVAERNVLRGPFEAEAEGRYEVAWSAVAVDGHREEGTFAFTIGSSRPDTPDTALPGPSRGGVIGLVLIGLTLAIIGRRLKVAR